MANPLLTDEQNRRLANQNSTYNQIMQGFAPVQQPQEDSWLGGLSRGAKAGFGGVGAGLLHAGQAAFGTDGSLAAGFDAMAKNNAQRREWDLADTLSLDYLTNPEGLAYGIGQIAGSMALSALFGAGVAAAVPTGGTSLLGTGALIGAAGAAPMAISEGGNTYAQGLQQGMTEDEAKKAGLTDAAIKLPFYMLSEGLSGKVAQGLISKGLLNAEGKSLGRRAAESGAKILGNAANEAYEEGTENRSSAYALGDQRISSLGNIFNPFDWNEEDKAQAVGVFTPTLALGALTGGAGHLRSRFDKKSSDVAEEIASEDGGTIEEAPEANVSGREAFINAIAGQESGGNYNAENGDTGAYGKYQILPSNWPEWAEEAGIGADAPRTPENQEIVARFKLGQYYDKYGARGAAIAWYGGEGALNYSEEALNRKQGDNGEYPSINEYADEVLGRMGNVADSARIDDTEENYFDESNYTDDTIPDSLNPVRGFDVSHLDKGTAQDRNSLLYGERVKKAKPAPAGEEVASFNQSLDNSNTQKAPNSLFVKSPRSWDAAERIYKARAKEQAERKARAQAIVNIANAQQQSFLNVLRNRAAQQWDNAEQAYKDRKQDKLQSLANVINARAAQKWDAKEADNTQKAKAEQEKQAQLQNIARLLDARAAGQYDVAQQVYANRAKEQAERKARAQALVPVNNTVAPQMSRMGHGELTLQNGRAQGLTDEEQAIINRYQGNPDAFNRKFKESVESVQAAVQRGDITQDVGRAYLKNLANMYDTVIGPIQNNGVIMQRQAPAIIKMLGNLRDKRRRGDTGVLPNLLQENGNADRSAAFANRRAAEQTEKQSRQQAIANIINARAAQKWDKAETEYISSGKGIAITLPKGATAEAKFVKNKKNGKKEIELKFSGKKSSDEFKSKLKAYGFRWNVGRKAWVAEENVITKAVATRLTQKENEKGNTSKQVENTAEPAQDKVDNIQAKRTQAKQAIEDAPKGKTVEATTDNGVKFGVQYAIVPADSLITSNNASDFSNNEAYPQELQPRDRNRAYMRLQVEKMSGTIEPERITTGTSVNEGAPIVNKEGIVENGNGRTMALARMWRSGNKKLQKTYRDYLAKNAVKFGLLSSSLKGIDNPILVRIRTDNNVSVSEVTASTKGGAQLSTAEQALQDSKKLKDSTLAKYEQNRLGTIDNAKNAEFVRAVFKDIIPEDELNAYTTTDGSLSKSGRQRAVNAILAKAYGADPVLFNLVESTDEAYGKIGDALIAAAPTIAKLKALASNQTLFDVDLAGEILKAIKFVSNAKANNMAVFDAVSQQSMFADYNVDELTKKLALFIDNNKGAKWKNIVDMVTVSSDVIAKKGSPLQGNVFGEEVKAPTAEEVLTTAINRVTNGEATAIIRMNDEKGQIEIKFVGNVSESVKKKLAKAKFKLSLEEQMWHADRNAASMKVAKELGYEEQGGNNGSISIFDEEAQAERNAGETASTESIKNEAKQPAESNQDEVNKKAVSKNASGIDKAKVQEVLEAISDTEVFDGLAEPTNINKMIVGKSKEELYKIAIDNIKSKLGKIFTDPLSNKIYFAPGNTESIEDYALHLIAGMGKLVEDIRVQRVLGVLLSDKTIQKPWAIIRQANGRKMYLSVYRGANSMTNGLIIGVEEGQDGRVVTSMLTANKKGDKKAALREFKKHVSGADEVLYIWEGLTGHSRPSSDQQASTANASLDPSGNQSIAQPAENVKKLNLPKGTTVDVSIVGDNSNIIQVKFNGAQGEGTGGIMGRAGYKWKSDKQVWQARKTEKAMDVAEQLGYTEEAKPQESARQQRLQESNERATQSLVAQNKDESVPGKRYTVRNKFFSVTILDGVIRVKDASKINPQSNRYNFSLTVEEYQRAAQNGNRLAGISKLLKAKIREGIENWIEESPNERTKEVRKQQNDEAQIVQATDEHFEVAYPLIESALQKAGIEALDHQSLFERAKKAKPSADTFSKNPDALFNSEDKSQQTDKYKNYSKEDIKINKERLATMPDVDGILQPAAKKFAEFFKAHFPKSDYTYETVDFWNNYILEFEQLNKILKKYRQATQQGDLSAADAYFQQISSSLDRLNNLLGKLVGKDKEEQQAQMRQEFRDSIIPFFDEYNKIVDKHNAKEDAKKASKAKKQQNQGKQEYKYYLNARPADVGAVPKGFIRVDTEDKGGRYGAIYYDRQLNDTDVQQYELKSADDVEKEKAQKEALETVSKELLKSDKLKAQAKNNSIGDFVLAYRDAVDDYLAEHVDENPAYTKLLNNPEIADEFLESESIIEKAYDKLKASDNSQDVVQSNKGNTNEGGNNNGIDITGKLSSNDTGSRRAENEIRTTSSSEESSGSNGQGSRTLEGQSGRNGNNGVPGSRTAVGGKTSISKGSEQVSAVRENPARSAELSGSVVDSLQEQPNVDEGSTDKIVESVADGRTDAADTVNQKVNEVVKENNLDRQRADRLRKTAKVMPFLSKIQFSNTDFVADRLADNGKQGVMITDGTGTGKTFSGLAVAKEMVEDGKENILIVTPSDSVNNQWANAAKDFFGIKLSKLDNIQDAGKGAVITTYANLGANDALIKRDWDLVICDESHYLMNNEQGEKTAALAKLRQLTLHPRELRARAEERILPEEKLEARRTIAQAAKLKRKKGQLKASEEAIVEKAEKLQKEKADELSKEERAQVEAQVKDWEQLNATEKPKVMFMSATPFAYVPDIDYAEGYLFDYPKVEGGSYNQPGNGFQQFMIEHFGYHMRYNKLTKPDKAVDNAVMEVEFHEWLRKTGALTGHELEIDKDYNRGFLLVDQGVGKKIDEGFEFLRNNHDKYRELEGVLNKQFDSRRRNYLLESIKARESVPIIQQYLKAGKKVVVFYETNVERESFNPFKFTQQTKELLQSGENRWTSEEIQREMEMFAKERPDLVNLNLDELSEPISIYREAFGDDAMFFNGRVSKNKRAEYVKAFNDDNSGKNLIFVQQDAGNAGISLHDTTGKHQRVLINIGIPRRPSYAIQIEGRIYRLGNKSNAIIRYLTTATNIENGLFAETVAGRASTAENLALGRRARGLRDSFKNAYQEIFDGTWEDRSPGTEGEDVGGKENDRNIVSTDSDYDRAKAFYFARGKKTAKNKAAEGVDYFATPEPVGYKMVQWAGLKDGDRVLEPSAGHGAISRFFSPNTDNTIIEPSSRLAPQAQMNTDNAKLINGYFEDLHIGNKYDAVTMNPPFGTGGKTAVEHVAKAFKHLRNGGRVIAIIPRGAMADKRFDAWYESDDAKDAHMVGEVLLPGVTFERAGTKVATRIVIIDKGGESQGVKRIDLSRINNINELFDNLESVEMPARQTKQADAGTANFANSLRKGDAEGNSEVVTADSYKHTKTGEIIPSAKLNANLSDEEYRKVKSIADKNGGYYSRYAKAFLFQDNETGRDKFVEEVNGANNTQYSVYSEAVQRVKKEIDEEIRKALPGAKMLPMSGDAYLVELPNGKTIFVKIAEEIIQKGKTREKALKDHNLSDDKDLVVGGFWQKWENLDGKSIDGILAVSIEGSEGTAFHESLHAAMDLCLNEKEKAALYKYYAKKAKESGRVIDEEIADGYKEWALKRQRGQGSMFGKLFQKVTDFLNKLYTMFAKANNKGNIFRKLESGEAWKQQGEKISQGAQYAVTNNAITGETLVPIVDVSGLSKADISTTALQSNIARGLIGKTFRIIGSNGIGKVANVKEGKHLLNSSKVRARNETARLKTLTAIDDVLNNAVYVEKHSDERHGSNDKYIELYAVVKNNDNLFRFRIVAKEGDKQAGDYEVKIAKFYDIIKDGKVTANAQSALPAIIPDGMKGQVRGTLPSTISVAKLLTGVKGSDGKLLVNKNGGLNYNSEIFKGIKEPADYSVKYSVASPKHKIANAFTNTERKGVVDSAKDFFKEHRKSLYQDWFDKNNPLKGFDALTKATGGLSVYDQVQSLPATTAGMLKALTEGTAQHVKMANQHLKNVKMKYNVTLAMALEKIDKKQMDKAYPKYLAENGFDNWVNALGAYLGAERCLEMARLARAEGKTYKFPKGLTEQECQDFVNKAPQQFKAAADIFYKVNDNVISIMEDAEVFSHDLAKTLRTKYRKYCPLLRDFSDTAAADSFIGGLTEGGRGIGNVSVPLKRINIEGSERGVLNPLETILKSYAVMLNRAERNKVALMAVENSRTADLHELIQEVPGTTADPKNCVFTVLINGKKKAYKTTQDLYGPIVGYNLPAANLAFGVARTAARMLRTGATMSPSFILRNVLRDTVFAGIASKNGFIPIVDTVRGAIALAKDPAMRAEFEAAGVTEYNFYSSQKSRIKSLDAMAGETPASAWEIMKAVFSRLEATSDFFESSTRMGEYMKARQKGLSMEEAARAAREVTLDFSRSGRVGEQVNQVVPFFNACLQGGDKMVRLFREDFVGTSLKVFKYIVLPSLLIMAMNWDEDWYKDLDPDIKNNYWCLGRNIRIPKPQEAGVLFGSGIEALFQQAADKDKDAVSNFLKAFSSNMIPSVLPTLILPLIEWSANYSFFKGRPLVGNKYSRLPDELQYNDYTSELSKGIGSALKVSPMKIDNLVRGYTGTMGALLWSMAGEPFAKANNLPTKHFSELPFVRDFNVTDANLSRPMNEFYGILDKANRQHAGYGVKGKPEAAVKGIRSAGSMISKIRKDIDKITHSNLTPERKRELIDKRKEKMNQIAKQATARYGKYFE